MPDDECRSAVDTLILPGLNGSGEGHWQWHLARELPGCAYVEQDDWACPDLDDWLARLHAALAHHGDVFIVAHSLGCILAANLAESPLVHRIRGALLVAPADLEAVETLHPCIVRFGEMPRQRLPFRSVVVGSRDDPYMDFATVSRMALAWGSDFVDLGCAGHINVASGFGRWPGVHDLVAGLRRDAGRDLIAAGLTVRAGDRQHARPTM